MRQYEQGNNVDIQPTSDPLKIFCSCIFSVLTAFHTCETTDIEFTF